MGKHSESEPDLVATVVADLPEEVFMESSDKPSLTISLSSKRKRKKESENVDAISELHTGHMEVELSQHKLILIQHNGLKTSNDYKRGIAQGHRTFLQEIE